MAEYLVELYVAQDDHLAAQQNAERAQRASAELTREGRPVRCLSSIYVSEDETCFLLYEAASAELVEEAIQRAGLRHEHISVATTSPSSRPHSQPRTTPRSITTRKAPQ